MDKRKMIPDYVLQHSLCQKSSQKHLLLLKIPHIEQKSPWLMLLIKLHWEIRNKIPVIYLLGLSSLFSLKTCQ